MRDHVVYEPRLELSLLIFADYDQAVQRILAQPFLLKAKVDGKVRHRPGPARGSPGAHPEGVPPAVR